MRLKTLLLYIIVTGTVGQLYAQSLDATNYFLPSVLPKSPGSAAFAKYGDYQVNLFTGVPDISIPLYTVQAGGLEVPITLSYHASGIKVADVASWVGMGWTVSAGGSITRKVEGLPDESASGLLQPGIYHSSIDVNTIKGDIDYADYVMRGMSDSRPDIFSYNFPGHNGNFFFEGSNSLKPALVPFAPIVINHSIPNSTNLYKMHFNVLDEHGNVYNFGNAYIEGVATSAAGRTSNAITGWMLENMISQNRRDTIFFSYTQQTVNYPDGLSQVDQVIDQLSGTTNYIGAYTPNATGSTTTSGGSEQDVASILFKNGKVVFELGPAVRTDQTYAHPLNDIQIWTYDYASKVFQLQKKIVFNTGYLYGRLVLNSIQILDAAGATVQQYSFTYNTAVTMPAYGSMAKDFWGYYNGKDNSNSLIPQITFPSPSNGTTYYIGSGNPASNNRNTDGTYMQAMILQSITYPTGGYTNFTFEPNQYTDGSGNLNLVGGLRIATIKSYDQNSPNPIIKSYQYNQARYNSLLNLNYFINIQHHNYWGALGVISGTAVFTSFVSNPQTDPVPFDQALVVYPSVTEYTGTSATNAGRTDYIFRDYPDAPQTSIGGTPIIQNNFYLRGQLASKSDYMLKSDGTYQIVKKQVNTYTAFAQSPHGNAGWAIDKTIWQDGPYAPPLAYYDPNNVNYAQPNQLNGFAVQNYSITSDDNYITSSTTYNYDTTNPANYTTSTVNYTYNNSIHQQVSSTSHTDSKGNAHVTNNQYPADYLSGSSTGNLLLDTMLNRNMQAEVIEKWETLNNVATSTTKVTGGQLNYFKFGSLSNSIVPASISILNCAVPLLTTDFVQSKVFSGNITADSRYTKMISFDNYDGQNNILQYTPRNATPVSILWDYLSELPIAQAKNAKTSTSGTSQNIAYTSFEADGKGNWTYSGKPVNDATAPDGAYSYNLSNGPIVSASLDNAKSYVVSYWSSSGAATVLPTGGSAVSSTALRTANGWTYYEHIVPSVTATITISGTVTIDALRLYPTDAQMTTYAYDPSGLRSIMDTKGQISYFEFDPFQRLKNIKDWNGNIVKNYGYHTYDQIMGNDAVSSVSFTRNNCPPGYTGNSTTLSLAANTYYAADKNSANNDATYNLQNQANKTCACTLNVPFVIHNNTSSVRFSLTFGSLTPYVVPVTNGGSATINVPPGTYTLTVFPQDASSHVYNLGTRSATPSEHTATFTSVIIANGSSDLTLTIN